MDKTIIKPDDIEIKNQLFHQHKIPFSIKNKDDELSEKYNEIWGKIKNSIKNEFDSEPAYNEKYLKAKIKIIKYQ